MSSHRRYVLVMWKVKLDDGVWLANGVGGSGITRYEAEAWLFPDIPSVKLQLVKARRLLPYPHAVVIFEDNQAQPISE